MVLLENIFGVMIVGVSVFVGVSVVVLEVGNGGEMVVLVFFVIEDGNFVVICLFGDVCEMVEELIICGVCDIYFFFGVLCVGLILV